MVREEKIHLGKIFDLTLPLAGMAKGYPALDQRSAIKVLFRP